MEYDYEKKLTLAIVLGKNNLLHSMLK